MSAPRLKTEGGAGSINKLLEEEDEWVVCKVCEVVLGLCTCTRSPSEDSNARKVAAESPSHGSIPLVHSVQALLGIVNELIWGIFSYFGLIKAIIFNFLKHQRSRQEKNHMIN